MPLKAEVPKIVAFLARYNEERTMQTIGRAHELADVLKRMLPAVEGARQEQKALSRRSAPEFNLFKTLRVTAQEAAHSNFIGELLDPVGAHAQGLLFLRSFLEACAQKQAHPAFSVSMMTEDWVAATWIKRESTIFAGRCDLLIKSPHLCLLVENKIHAPELDKQLIRYRDWITSKENADEKFLVFLTPDGRNSTDIHIRDDEYIRMSYVSDIRDWLNGCLPYVHAPIVRTSLEQYLEVLSEWGEVLDAETDA